ncbi:MAG: protease HtpX [Verrucomicrobia bacterium]|nr:protease HtpX [Verrucomicrobiota bacterium]
MNFGQTTKRVFLFLAVNLLVLLTISIVLSLLGVHRHIGGDRNFFTLLIFCGLYGFAGAFISLALSRLMAKWMMGVEVIPPDTDDPAARALVSLVHELAQNARLPAMPQVGVYESPEVNAFATGPTRSRSLVAVSSGLLQNMERNQLRGVLAHEIAHIANGDMVTMTLIQGVINAFVMFFARIAAWAVSNALRRNDDDRPSYFIQSILVFVFEIAFSLLGSIVTCWFSRWREFRADAGGAHYGGKQNMISALRGLQRLHDEPRAAAQGDGAFAALKISGGGGGLMALLFSTHPPLESRIAALEQLPG